MKQSNPIRSGAVIALFVLLLSFFVYRLYILQVYETGGVVDNTTTYTVRTRVKAARGEILDRNGNVLVGNRATYSLVINHYVLTGSENPNNSILELVSLCNELGIGYTDSFPVTRERPFTYTLDQYNSTWQGYFQTFLKERGELDSDISAPLLIRALRESYRIPEEWTDEQARLVLGLRYELTLRNHTNLPMYVFIADARDDDLSAILELNVPGLNVESSTVREYYTEYAAHILGFVGAMDKAQWEHYKQIDGYEMDAQVGQAGLELAFEEYLHGIDGERVDEVMKDGTVVRSYFTKEPVAGNNVELTIDINLQRAAEDQLAETVAQLRSNADAPGHDAEGAAAVVIEVETGEVLACASYPTYDLETYFVNYKEILEAEGNPLFNRALNAAYPPGSTYKMSMTVAAINNKYINSTYEIVDRGVFTKYDGFSPKCLIYTNSGGSRTHGAINAVEALCVSCNYFFYELGDIIRLEDCLSSCAGGDTGTKTAVFTGSLSPGLTGERYVRLMTDAARRGLRIALDIDGLTREQLAEVSPWLYKPNAHELARLTGADADDDDGLVEQARLLAEDGVGVVLLTLGERGLAAVTAEGTYRILPRPVTAVNTVGAGDAALAAFVAAEAEGCSVEECARRAARSGEQAVTEQ